MVDSDIKLAFVHAALAIEFPTRYYGICKRYSLSTNDDLALSAEDVAAEVSRLPLKFKRYKKHATYECEEPLGTAEVSLTLAVLYRTAIEAIVGVSSGIAQYGHSFDGLALDAATSANPSFDPKPKYPRPRFSTREELGILLPELCQLYFDFRSSLVTTAPSLFKGI